MQNQYKIQSTVPLIRMLIQQSNCFVVVERGVAMNNAMQERNLDRSGETRQGSNFGKGQMVSADYTINPTITFSAKDAGGLSGALGGFSRQLGSLGAAAGAARPPVWAATPTRPKARCWRALSPTRTTRWSNR